MPGESQCSLQGTVTKQFLIQIYCINSQSYHIPHFLFYLHPHNRTPGNGPRRWSTTSLDVASSPATAPFPSTLVRSGAWSPHWRRSPPLMTSLKPSTPQPTPRTFPAHTTAWTHWTASLVHTVRLLKAPTNLRPQGLALYASCITTPCLTQRLGLAKFLFFMPPYSRCNCFPHHPHAERAISRCAALKWTTELWGGLWEFIGDIFLFKKINCCISTQTHSE